MGVGEVLVARHVQKKAFVGSDTLSIWHGWNIIGGVAVEFIIN